VRFFVWVWGLRLEVRWSLLADAVGEGVNHRPRPRSPQVPRADAKVAIVSCRSYTFGVQDAFTQAFGLLGDVGPLVNGKTVTVKINLTCGGNYQGMFGRPPGESYITDGRTAAALASVLLSQGAQKIRFVDSVHFRQPLDQVLAAAGWDAAALLALGRIELENTRNLGSGSQYVQMNVPGGGYLFSFFELNHSYRDTDVFVSLAKMKQHLTAGVTLSMKNVFGSTPNSRYGADAGTEDAVEGRLRLLHGEGITGWGPAPPPGARTDRDPGTAGSRIPRIVADLCAARPVHLAIIDGITAMSGGEGPWAPNAAFTTPGVLIAGLNPVSTDAVGMAVMGYSNPRADRGTRPFQTCDNHLLLAEQAGLGTADLSQIDVRGLSIQQALYPYPG
jgi:uncharacterized protein (DUF362 family)